MLVRQISSVFIGNLANTIALWLFSYLLTRKFGLDGFGNYSLLLALATPLFAFTNQDLKTVISIDLSRQFDDAGYFLVRLFQNAVGMSLFCVVAYVYYGDLLNELHAALSIVLYKVLDSLSDLLFGLHNRAGAPSLIGLHLLFRSGVIVLFCLLLYTGVWSITYYILPISCFIALIALERALLVRLFNSFMKKFSFNLIRCICLTAAPAGLAMFFSSLNSNLSKYLVDYFFDTASLGVFVWLMYLIVPANMVMSATGIVLLPRLKYRLRTGDKLGFLKVLSCHVALAVLVVLAMSSFYLVFESILAGYLGVFYEHVSSNALQLLILFSILCLQSVLGTTLASMKRFGDLNISVFIGFVVLILMIYLKTSESSYSLQSMFEAMAIASASRLLFLIVRAYQGLMSSQIEL